MASYRQWLLDEGLVAGAVLEAIEEEVAAVVEDAVEFAKSSPPADPAEELLVDVFADVSEVPT